MPDHKTRRPGSHAYAGGVTLSIGLSIPEVIPTPEAVDLAVSLEAVGFDRAWFTEIDRDPFVRCAATLAGTTRLRVATGIALWSRSPVTTAMTAAELYELSDGRFELGIGSGSAFVNEGFHGIPFARPARRMAEYLAVMHGAWDAHDRPFDFAGDHFTVSGFTQPYFRTGPSVLLAAVGEGMVRLAGRQADGILMNPSTTPDYLRTQIAPQLDAGATQAARSLEGFERAVCIRCSVDADRATARRRARHGIVEYGRYTVHQAQYARYGFGREAERIAAACERGDDDAALAAVSEEMVDILGLAGTPDEVRHGLRRWDGLVDSVSLLSPTLGLGADEVRANCAAVVDAFAV